MTEFAVDDQTVEAKNCVAVTTNVVVEDEEIGVLKVKLTDEGLIADVWEWRGKEAVATRSITYQELAEELLWKNRK